MLRRMYMYVCKWVTSRWNRFYAVEEEKKKYATSKRSEREKASEKLNPFCTAAAAVLKTPRRTDDSS